MRSERRFRYLVTRDFKPLAYYHSVVNSNKKQIPQRRWVHELRQRYTRKTKVNGPRMWPRSKDEEDYCLYQIFR